MSNGKLYKLLLHQKTQQKSYAAEDLAFSRDFLNLEVNDVIEIYNPDEENSPRLLLHVSKGSLRDDFPQKDAISLETSIANTFLLRSNSDIIVNKIVNPSIIELDSIELTFKDQYLGRSEMWRLKNNLINTCVYLNKKIEFCSSSIRCNVYELWSKGEKVTSGKVSESTKIVYRSSSSMVYLFIQMSSEMWEFDITGDLYFEKAVNGFLGELFNKWKKNGSNHEVTIVLFSRIFYNATSLEDFPELMKECLQIDHKKRFYEDFYRVAAQNEKMDDWLNILTNLRQMFVHYEEDLLNLYKVDGSQKIPTGVISRSAEGNFLEVLNMSLNVFEKHYLDRSFDRTGQLSVVVTPGVGVFEVDRELTNVTMQRIIDNGVGSDLVCIGEQPLHAVPLLKFHSKGLTNSIYSLPHWINLSFYSTNKRYGYGSYSPRIKLPLLTNTNSNNQNATSNESTVISGFHTCTNYDQIRIPKLKLSRESENMWPNSVYDYDDYDANIFTLPNNPNANSTQQSQSLQRRTFQHHRKKIASAHVHNRSNPNEIDIKLFRRQNSEPDMHYEEHDISPSITTTGAGGGKLNESTSGYDFFQSRMNDRDRSSPIVSHRPNSGFASSSPILHETQTIPIPPAVKHFVKKSEHLYSSSFGALNIEMKPKKMGPSVGLLNKDRLFFDDYFQPTSIGQTTSSKMLYSSNSPSKDLRPIFTQQQLKNLQKPSKSLINPFDPSNQRITLTSSRRRWTHIFPRGPTGQLMQEHHQHSKLDIVHEGNGLESPDASESPVPSRATTSTTRKVSESGFLKERKLTLLWSATGEQSWSSSLKTGVDWKSLTIPACLPITTDYSPEDSSLDLDYVVSNYNLLPDDDGSFMSSKEVFLGLISQRLAQGFQLIIPHSTSDSVSSVSKKIKSTSSGQSTPLLRSNTIPKIEEKEEYFMSIGRIFHKLNLTGDKITVTRYRPKHPYPALKIHYRYRFKAPHNQTYAISWSEFETDRLENFNWNYLDNYICTRGDIEYPLMDSLKFWRFRIYLLPSYQSATKRILENSNEFCNIYTELNDDEKFTLLNGYLNFIEICINRIKRDGPRSRGSQGALIFRERVGSNRLTERPQLKSTSKPSETENAVAADNTVTNLELTDDSAFQDIKIKSTASLQEIIEAIKSSNSGFPFITSSSLRKFLFVSCDSIFWLIEHMESIATESQAIEKFNEMLNKQLICHASGDTKHPFLNGFYLYNIVSNDPKDPSQFDKLFKNEWMEVEIEAEQIINKNFIESSIIFNVPKAPSSSTSNENNEITPPIDNFFVSHLNPLDEKRKASISKECFLELDITKKSERSEWGHLKYQSLYRPSEAYSLEITWLQGTGSIITDLIQGWARKAQQCNLQLIPIPSDPFALPYTYNSDSLRGPIFIPLNTECLLENQSYLFEEFPESTWEKRSFLFQEAIIFHFGFIKCSFNNANGVGSNYQSKYSKDQSSALEDENHYVHVTGNMFILIPTGAKQKQDSILIRRPSSVTSQSKASFESGSNNLHEDYITRHVSGAKQGLSKSEINQKSDKNGFLWFWNYMISKRWKTSSTLALGDDAFMDRLRKDFQAFCSNDQNRLKNFWNQCRQNAKLTSTINKKTNLMVKEEEINVPELVDTHSQFFALDLRFKNDFCETRKI